MRVIGTAGHVDHGKSTLVLALTGIDPDRLKEEKQRQMTIDLGFAWFETQNGDQIGMVDVPGHLDFIENMIAGVGGIDAVLFVVAGDEGIMPQTKEHLAILSLLKIKKGIVVLTKIDKVGSEWLDLVELDLRSALAGSALESADILRVSALTGEGIPELKQRITDLVSINPQPADRGKPRLPVDRVFTLSGFGTIVTGTLTGGSLQVGTTVEIPGSGKKVRIRGLQIHKRIEDKVLQGSRTAVNLSGIDVNEIHRGDVICLPGTFIPTSRLDVQIEILPAASTGIKHDDLVKFFLYTSERIGRIRLLGKSNISPGEVGWVQIELDRAVVAEEGDRFIIRRVSPGETLGGGVVVNPHPARRYKLSDSAAIKKLEERLEPSLADRLCLQMEGQQFIKKEKISQLSGWDEGKIAEILATLVNENCVLWFNPGSSTDEVYITTVNWTLLQEKLISLLEKFHKTNPLRFGIPVEEIHGRISLPVQFVPLCLARWAGSGLIRVQNGLVAKSTHEIQYSLTQDNRIKQFLALINKDPFNTPSVKIVKESLGEDVYQSLVDQESIIQVNQDVLFRKEEYQTMLVFVNEKCGHDRLISVSEFRDHFTTSRKYSLAFLEYLDKKGITEREGDGRCLVINPGVLSEKV